MKATLKKVGKIIFYLFLSIVVVLAFATWYYYPGNSEVDEETEVSFMYQNDVIIVKASINNSGPYNFVLDTGTDPSVINKDLADQLSFYQLSVGEQDVGENEPIDITMPLPMKLKVGALPSSRKMFLALDIKGMSEEMEMPIHGILGHNFIRDNILQIDYQRQVLTFLPHGINPYQQQSGNVKRLELSFIEDGKLPRINVLSVNGKPLNATLDTGSNKGLTLFKACVDYLELKDELANAQEIESLSYGGAHTTKIVENLVLEIEGWTIPDSQINLDLESEKAKVGLDIRGGNIGNKILKNYLLTLDYKNSLVWFEKTGS